jgi:Flp pilus assembly protein TadD
MNYPDTWREKQIRQWFKQHRQAHFEDLDIWDLDWSADPAAIKQPADLPAATNDDLTGEAIPFIEQAEQCQNHRDFHGAGRFLMKALDWAPNVVDLILATAVAHLQSGEAQAARWLAVRATVLQPDHPLAFVRLAEAALALDLQPECDSALARAIALVPSDPAVLGVLGSAKLARQEFAEAATCFRQVLEQKPGDIPTLLRLGLCYSRIGDIGATLAAYAEILRLEPGHKLALKNLEFFSQ